MDQFRPVETEREGTAPGLPNSRTPRYVGSATLLEIRVAGDSGSSSDLKKVYGTGSNLPKQFYHKTPVERPIGKETHS